MTKNIPVVDLFAGAGGFSCGFDQTEAVSYHSELAIEIDKWASDTYRENFSEANVLTEDIRNVVNEIGIESVLPDDVGVIIGGPPCQDFSISNTHSKVQKDPEESLFRYFIDFIEHSEPPAFVIENVTGIQNTEATTGETILNVVERFLGELPYHSETLVLFAGDYGVPQRRERIFFVGIRDDLYDGENLMPQRTHIPKDSDASTSGQGGGTAGQLKLSEVNSTEKTELKPYWTLWDAISDLPQVEAGADKKCYEYPKSPQNNYQELLRDGSEYVYNHVPMNHTDRIVERFKHIDWGESQSDVPEEHAPHIRGDTEKKSDVRYDQNNRRLHPHTLSHTITASFYSNFVHPYLHRNLTAREGARVQSFPDTHVFKGKKTTASKSLLKREGREDEAYMHQFGQIGNAVPPLLAKAIGETVGEVLSKYY